MIRAVVVDDSALARKLVSQMLESDPAIKVVGTAMNGVFALRRVYRDKPDVVTMDFEMPQMDGLETVKTLMERHPVPVVMLSAHTRDGADLTLKALELGAVDFILKPDGRESEVLGQLREELIAKVKAAAGAHLHGGCRSRRRGARARCGRPQTFASAETQAGACAASHRFRDPPGSRWLFDGRRTRGIEHPCQPAGERSTYTGGPAYARDVHSELCRAARRDFSSYGEGGSGG